MLQAIFVLDKKAPDLQEGNIEGNLENITAVLGVYGMPERSNIHNSSV